ncbi:uncharacterized protein LOC119585190 isoform X2 [Penaeus monodon]|uniref:uncharacterized protein LOC119585190 isoform X2 n=1 Tax=Penaeus monodon TaxID=6687 RepID=UPI0018A7A147|nr:uncharacterized protein LOC119585190 isoform X2 [Penaeus monodon]
MKRKERAIKKFRYIDEKFIPVVAAPLLHPTSELVWQDFPPRRTPSYTGSPPSCPQGQVSSRAEERQLRCPEEEYSERQAKEVSEGQVPALHAPPTKEIFTRSGKTEPRTQPQHSIPRSRCPSQVFSQLF